MPGNVLCACIRACYDGHSCVLVHLVQMAVRGSLPDTPGSAAVTL